MKIQTLFDLLESAQDLLSYFDEVTTPQQLVSRLERLKRQDPEGILDDVLTLRACVDTALAAQIELGGSLGETLTSDDKEPDKDDIEDLLANFPDSREEETPKDAPGNQPTNPSTPEKENPTT